MGPLSSGIFLQLRQYSQNSLNIDNDLTYKVHPWERQYTWLALP